MHGMIHMCVVSTCVYLCANVHVCSELAMHICLHHHSHGSNQMSISCALVLDTTVIETRTLLCGELTSRFVCIFTFSHEYVCLSDQCSLRCNLNISKGKCYLILWLCRLSEKILILKYLDPNIFWEYFKNKV